MGSDQARGGRFHSGEAVAQTAEELMRSRYAA